MCYLRFDKTEMTNLQDSLYKEMLLTNDLGAYCCTTLVGCNIRKYHGLLVTPVPNLDDENHVLSLRSTRQSSSMERNSTSESTNTKVRISAPKAINTSSVSSGIRFRRRTTGLGELFSKGDSFPQQSATAVHPLHTRRSPLTNDPPPAALLGIPQCPPMDTRKRRCRQKL